MSMSFWLGIAPFVGRRLYFLTVWKNLRAVDILPRHTFCLGRCVASVVVYIPEVCGVFEIFDIALIARTLRLRVF